MAGVSRMKSPSLEHRFVGKIVRYDSDSFAALNIRLFVRLHEQFLAFSVVIVGFQRDAKRQRACQRVSANIAFLLSYHHC